MDRVVTDTAGLHAAAWQNLFEQPERGKQVEVDNAVQFRVGVLRVRGRNLDAGAVDQNVDGPGRFVGCRQLGSRIVPRQIGCTSFGPACP
jgi:hypothetical protein